MPNFPNLFCLYGPGTNLADGASLFFHSEFQVHYAMDAIHETLASEAQWSEVRSDAHDDYVERYEAEIGQMVWAHPSIAHSHYKNRDGKVFTLSPWPLDLYWDVDPHMSSAGTTTSDRPDWYRVSAGSTRDTVELGAQDRRHEAARALLRDDALHLGAGCLHVAVLSAGAAERPRRQLSHRRS